MMNLALKLHSLESFESTKLLGHSISTYRTLALFSFKVDELAYLIPLSVEVYQ